MGNVLKKKQASLIDWSNYIATNHEDPAHQESHGHHGPPEVHDLPLHEIRPIPQVDEARGTIRRLAGSNHPGLDPATPGGLSQCHFL